MEKHISKLNFRTKKVQQKKVKSCPCTGEALVTNFARHERTQVHIAYCRDNGLPLPRGVTESSSSATPVPVTREEYNGDTHDSGDYYDNDFDDNNHMNNNEEPPSDVDSIHSDGTVNEIFNNLPAATSFDRFRIENSGVVVDVRVPMLRIRTHR